MELMDLPVVMIENIFTFLSYDEVAKNRIVSKTFNDICMRMLNRGFLMIERRHSAALKSVKMQLPRRESERRYHPLARHCDILQSIETRISMLNMTYTKFIDNRLCCFIPGRVIDEIKRVLQIVESTKTPPRAHEVLQELRDISSMAIEHFDDKISPAFRKKLQDGHSPQPRPQHVVLAPLAVRQEMLHLSRRSMLNAKLSLYLVNEYKKFHKKIADYKKVTLRQSKVIRDLVQKQKEQDAVMADLRKRIEECDTKYNDITHTNQSPGGIASSSEVAQAASAPLRHFSSQIKLDLSVLPIGTGKRGAKLLPNMKPRKPMIKLPSLSEDGDKPDERPTTSQQTQTSKALSQSTIAKIRGLTNEIRHLSNLSNSYEVKLKRPSVSDLDSVESKKKKMD